MKRNPAATPGGNEPSKKKAKADDDRLPTDEHMHSQPRKRKKAIYK